MLTSLLLFCALDAHAGGGGTVVGAVDLPRRARDPVLVYVEGEGPPLETGHDALIAQRGIQFQPSLLVVPVGTAVNFANNDTEFHHVFSKSGSNQFEIPEYAPEKTDRSRPLMEPGIVDVQCKKHPEMFAQILVVPNAWHVQVDGDDKGMAHFEITGIEPGNRTVVVWSPGFKPVRKQVHLTEGKSHDLGVLQLEARKRVLQLDLDTSAH